jgi:sugar transferase (PEP-CTERM/EpsH1 system associated)
MSRARAAGQAPLYKSNAVDISARHGQNRRDMRVLFVTNRFPGLLMRGDQLRAFQHIRLLAQRHAITLLSFGAPEGDRQGEAELAAGCERIIVAQRDSLGLAWRALRAMFGDLPLQVAAFDQVPRSARLGELLSTVQFDLAHVQLARLGPMLRRLQPLPCVLDLVDALSVNMARRAELDRGPLRLVARMDARRLAQYERRICAQARSVAVCSAPDRQAIGADNIHLVRNGVDLERFPFVATAARGDDIVFIGNLGYFPNIDAASWFAEEVMPLINERLPMSRLKLVGARPAARLRRLAARLPQVDLIGQVPEVHSYLARAAVAVVPLRSGSGQQLKVLEAMAAGTPVVSTSLSAAGLDAVDGEHLLIADNAATMADAVLRLMSDPALCARLVRAARGLVERDHTWSRSAHDLERLWLDAAN